MDEEWMHVTNILHGESDDLSDEPGEHTSKNAEDSTKYQYQQYCLSTSHKTSA